MVGEWLNVDVVRMMEKGEIRVRGSIVRWIERCMGLIWVMGWVIGGWDV